ncbi:MAG TPA: hypothetical protein VMU35_02535 [Methylomirabilota bacterium]|nr:hypothetical protein [Methylomirabilota bacterium]
MPNDDSYVCDGGNYSVSMTPQNLIIRARGWRQGLQRTMPIGNVQSVVVERKNLMPVATSATLLAIIGILVKYNALWFILDLNQNMSWKLSLFAFLPATLLAIPTVERILFVKVIIACFNKETWRVNLVRSSIGRDFAAKFQEFSGGA